MIYNDGFSGYGIVRAVLSANKDRENSFWVWVSSDSEVAISITRTPPTHRPPPQFAGLGVALKVIYSDGFSGYGIEHHQLVLNSNAMVLVHWFIFHCYFVGSESSI